MTAKKIQINSRVRVLENEGSSVKRMGVELANNESDLGKVSANFGLKSILESVMQFVSVGGDFA